MLMKVLVVTDTRVGAYHAPTDRMLFTELRKGDRFNAVKRCLDYQDSTIFFASRQYGVGPCAGNSDYSVNEGFAAYSWTWAKVLIISIFSFLTY